MSSATTISRAAPYTFKPGSYSSHTILLNSVPEDGTGFSVLDLGCASGYLSARLAERGYDVVPLDRPGTSAPDLSPGQELVEADLDHGLPPLGRRFDFVLSADVLEHLRDPRKMLRELAGALKPGGKLIASLPNSGNAYFRANVLMGRFPAHDRGLFDRTHLHFYTWDGWNALLAEGGFRIESVTSTAVPFSLALPRWERSAFVQGLEALSFALARVWKTLFAYQFVVRAVLE